MTLPEVARLFRYWRQTPALRDIVAAFVGVTDTPRQAPIELAELPPEFEE